MRFATALTHKELANMVGNSRETVTRMLGRFKRDKLIQIRGSSILLLSPVFREPLGCVKRKSPPPPVSLNCLGAALICEWRHQSVPLGV
ncbi:MAG: helix-turn-helix domain-containing protein [Granulicella sp.]